MIELNDDIIKKIQLPLWTVQETIDFYCDCFLSENRVLSDKLIAKFRCLAKEFIILNVKSGNLHLVDQIDYKQRFPDKIKILLSSCFKPCFSEPNLLQRKILPFEALIFFISTSHLEFPDEIFSKVINRKLPASCQDNESAVCTVGDDIDMFDRYIKEFINRRDVQNPGAKIVFEKRDTFVGQGAYYIQKMLDSGCVCRHDKLAKIAYFLGVNPDGVRIFDLAKTVKHARFDPLEALKRQAATMVPCERYYSNANRKYDPSKCNCEITEHMNFRGN